MVTRETKIGLLVGLVFIIVTGVFISDHITKMMQPPKAQPDISANVEMSQKTLGDARNGGRNFQVPQRVEPIVPIGPEPIIRPDPREQTGETRRQEPQPTEGIRIVEPRPGTGGGEIEHIRGYEGSRDDGAPDDAPLGTKRYTVKSGDTLMKISAAILGSSSEASRNKIIELNPSLKKDNGARLSVNQTLLVPDRNYRGVAPVIGGGSGPTMIRDTGGTVERLDATRMGPTPAVVESIAPSVAGPTKEYKTQPGDTLWKIAGNECGEASRKMIDQIKALNADLLKGKDAIRPNMTLKLPTKAASRS